MAKSLHQEFNESERMVIARFCDRAIAMSEQSVSKTKEMMRISDADGFLNQLTYWRHAIGAFKWAKSLVTVKSKESSDGRQGMDIHDQRSSESYVDAQG